jgi:hypothetical protein
MVGNFQEGDHLRDLGIDKKGKNNIYNKWNSATGCYSTRKVKLSLCLIS